MQPYVLALSERADGSGKLELLEGFTNNPAVSRTERFRRVIRCGAQQGIARWITSKRRRRWLHRLRAECPGGVPLWAANFRYSELPCILPVTDFLVLRARQ